MDSSFDFLDWTEAELARAGTMAGKFLTDNQRIISETLAQQTAALERLVALPGNVGMSLEQRLDCFARIGEPAEGMRRSADGFFDPGSQPLVARMLMRGE
jgi:hypothetical protein